MTNPLIHTFKQHLHEEITAIHPRLEAAVDFICDTHLDPKNYAMPLHSETRETFLALLQAQDFEAAEAKLEFEDTKTIEGIIRVMVRTHLNRQGVANIVQGAQYKTLAKRVLAPFTGAFDYAAMLNHEHFIECFEQAAVAYPQEYRESDIQDIQAAKKLTGIQQISTPAAKAAGVSDNWAKVLTGIYSGLLFLHKEYQFSPDKIWQAMDACVNDAEKSKRLTKKVQSDIHQYGTALAGSFLADLGHDAFLKPDVHVIASVSAIHHQANVSDQFALNYTHKLAQELGMPPRMLDKVFYIGCSGKLYLYDLKVKNAGQAKRKFLEQLGKLELSVV